jgi:hypothetical protein
VLNHKDKDELLVLTRFTNKHSNLYSILVASVRPSQVVVGVSNHKDKDELLVLTRFTNLDNRTVILN